MNFRQQAALLTSTVALTLGCASSQAAVVFDNMSAPEANGNTGLTSTGSTPNTFMGDGYVLAAGTTAITGFDLFPINTSGTNFTNLKINVFVWDNVNTGTVSAATPAFSNLLGSYSLTAAGSYTTGFFYSFEGDKTTTSGITLTTPLALADTTIGMTFNYQGSTDGGLTYASVNSLSSVISTVAPTVGSQTFAGYYRNANSETNGNFTSTLRSLNGFASQSVGIRIFGTTAAAVVPEPGAYLMMGLGLALFTVMRRRQAR